MKARNGFGLTIVRYNLGQTFRKRGLVTRAQGNALLLLSIVEDDAQIIPVVQRHRTRRFTCVCETINALGDPLFPNRFSELVHYRLNYGIIHY